MRNLLVLGLLLALLSPLTVAEQPKSITVPFIFDHNRVFVELQFVKPDHSLRTAKAFVDTGNHRFVIGRELARDVGATESAPPPEVKLGGMRLNTEGAPLRLPDRDLSLNGEGKLETNLPASIMRHYVVVLDYAARTLTLAEPGAVKPQGAKIACRVNAQTGLIAVDMTVGGQKYPVTIDVGSAYTWISAKVAQPWTTQHPAWLRGVGAVGDANMNGMGGEQELGLVRLPEMSIGPIAFREVGTGVVDQELFDWYSKKAPEAVVGFVGGNVVKGFKLTIDYPNSATYWLKQTELDPSDLDQVGLTITPEGDGSYTILGVTKVGERPVLDGVARGDRLLRINDADVHGKTMGAVLIMLHGKPGESRKLLLERAGKQFTVEAKVLRF